MNTHQPQQPATAAPGSVQPDGSGAVEWWERLAAQELAAAHRARDRGDAYWQQHHSDCVARNLRIADELRAKQPNDPR